VKNERIINFKIYLIYKLKEILIIADRTKSRILLVESGLKKLQN